MHSLVYQLKRTLGRALWFATTTIFLASPVTHVNAIPTQGAGDFDTIFAGGQGVIPSLTISVGGINHLTAMAPQSDGKIVMAGACSNAIDVNVCVARLYGGLLGYKNCAMDIDGDSKVLPTTDGLLLARISLGVTGNSTMAGASSRTAARNSWIKVRDCLVNQCGMWVAP